jgi:hypothetical protein
MKRSSAAGPVVQGDSSRRAIPRLARTPRDYGCSGLGAPTGSARGLESRRGWRQRDGDGHHGGVGARVVAVLTLGAAYSLSPPSTLPVDRLMRCTRGEGNTRYGLIDLAFMLRRVIREPTLHVRERDDAESNVRVIDIAQTRPRYWSKLSGSRGLSMFGMPFGTR